MDPYENSFEDSHGRSDELAASAPADDVSTPAERAPRLLPPVYASLFRSPPPDGSAVEGQSIEEFKVIMAARQRAREEKHDSFAVIPQFYFRKVGWGPRERPVPGGGGCVTRAPRHVRRKLAWTTRSCPVSNGKQTGSTCCGCRSRS